MQLIIVRYVDYNISAIAIYQEQNVFDDVLIADILVRAISTIIASYCWKSMHACKHKAKYLYYYRNVSYESNYNT